MGGMANCILCGHRKARRACPAAGGDICPQCCSEEREIKFQCPYSCDYLCDSRIHGRVKGWPDEVAHAEVNVPLDWVRNRQPIYLFAAGTLVMAAGPFPEVIDADVREAMETLIRNFKAADSGLILDAAPGNPIAARIAGDFHAQRESVDKSLAESKGATLRDVDLMKTLIFLMRYLDVLNNGRPKCRAFTDTIRIDMKLPVHLAAEAKSSLIL